MQIKCGECGELMDFPPMEEIVKPEFMFFKDHEHKPRKATVICFCGGTLDLGPGVDKDIVTQMVEMVKFCVDHAPCRKKEKWAN